MRAQSIRSYYVWTDCVFWGFIFGDGYFVRAEVAFLTMKWWFECEYLVHILICIACMSMDRTSRKLK